MTNEQLSNAYKKIDSLMEASQKSLANNNVEATILQVIDLAKIQKEVIQELNKRINYLSLDPNSN